MIDLTNTGLSIIASLLTIITIILGFAATKETPTKIIQRGNNNSVHIGKKKINIINIFMPSQNQIDKVTNAKREPGSDNYFMIVLFYIAIIIFGAFYTSYYYWFVAILLAVFIIRFIKFIRFSIAIKLTSNLYDKSKFFNNFIQQIILCCILLSLLFFSAPQELQIVADHIKVNFEGGTSFKIWLIDLFKYTFSIWNTTTFYFFIFRSAGMLILTLFVFYSTGKNALPIYKHNSFNRRKVLFNELSSYIFVIILIFFSLYPWIFIDLKNSLEPLWNEWARK
ncbi:hypothetical protein K4A81_13555 [Bacillus velezensis]|uniref:hypothetical protein n=1 Tax=Bacillus velezensis TaxID=492670 RepID=UPI000CD5447F|nr:hypothetical protein [Bacillus velezensis]POI15911.1 hypothetical protein C2145_07185 [Bacillus velezensis]QZY40249.1 hypothetical protein K4A81_13555 [Bacillus velezensis]